MKTKKCCKCPKGREFLHCGCECHKSHEKADACLIAQAPALLNIAKAVMESAEGEIGHDSGVDVWITRKTLNAIQKIVKKAEGK